MEGPFRLLLVALLLSAAAAAAATPQPATRVARFCATDDIPSEHCCEAVVAAVDLGGCLCRVAAEPKLVAAGLNATRLLTVYTSCGGLLRPGGARLAAAAAASCLSQGPAPPAAAAAVVFAPPPSPGPRRTQQAPHETPPSTTEKPPHHSKAPLAPAAAVISPAAPQQPHSGPYVSDEAPPSTTEKPPQQRDGATHSKAYAATSSLAAISPAVPHSAGSSSSQVYVSGGRYANKCAARQLADRLVLACDKSENAPSPICCQIVSTIVEQSCLCEVSEEAEVHESSHMGREQILFLYNMCGGEKQVPPGQCGPFYPPPPPSPPSSPNVVSHGHGRVPLAVLLPSLVGGLFGLLGIGYVIYLLVKWARTHGFLGGEPRVPARNAAAAGEARRVPARDAAAAAAEGRRARAAGDGTVQQHVGAARVAV